MKRIRSSSRPFWGIARAGTGDEFSDLDLYLVRREEWFWVDVIELSKQLARERRYPAQYYLGRLRSHCSTLLEDAEVDAAEVRERLLETFCRSEPAEIRAAAERLIGIHRELGAALAATTGLSYPQRLAWLGEAKLRREPAPGRGG